MNEYTCWVHGIKAATLETIMAESSFAARKQLAAKHGCEITDCVSQRVFEGETRKT